MSPSFMISALSFLAMLPAPFPWASGSLGGNDKHDVRLAAISSQVVFNPGCPVHEGRAFLTRGTELLA